jgi:hypothetical protein
MEESAPVDSSVLSSLEVLALMLGHERAMKSWGIRGESRVGSVV